ncbi:hypothetical protein [Sporomusa carbonis]|uniref:hypothetical protein n=1 Tax=Sporomusa carbonis TaxID=3076075 RepID=UPI003C7CD120
MVKTISREAGYAISRQRNLSPEDERIRKLERENRELREEIEILKKAAAYFAKNQK